MNQTINTIGYPRAALAGNPSDGFNGRTIAFTFSNYSARVTLTPSDDLRIQQQGFEAATFDSVDSMLKNIIRSGYQDSIALLQATLKQFMTYCTQQKLDTSKQCFMLYSKSDIPFQVGIAGSSAIIIALLRALMRYYDVSIPKHKLAAIALSVETEELGIPGGLQDRVAQVYEGLTYMDFDRSLFHRQGFGHYESLDPVLLPPLYIAMRQSTAEGSEIFHNNIRERYADGDDSVIQAIEHWKKLTIQFRQALLENKIDVMHEIINENFDRRASMYKISKGNLEMIDTARICGASAKFTGSGGAVIGIYHDDDIYREMQRRFSGTGVLLFKPRIVVANDNEY